MSGLETGIGTEIVVWFQGANPVLGWVLMPLHFIGGQYGYLVLLPIIYWAVSKRDGKRLMILSLGSALVAQYLKFTFRRPRPPEVSPDRIVPFFSEGGFGIPSGHTVFGTVVGGYVWYRFPGRWTRVAGVAFALSVGISRMVHGLHFPQDVVAGGVLGILLLILFWWIDTRYSRALRDLPIGRSMLIIGVIAIAGFVLSLALEPEFEGRKDLLAIVGAILGGLVGFKLESHYVGFSHQGPAGQRILRCIVGLVVTVALFLGLDVLYDIVAGDAIAIGAMILYTVRYGLVALFIAAGAPALFIRLRLAGKVDGP